VAKGVAGGAVILVAVQSVESRRLGKARWKPSIWLGSKMTVNFKREVHRRTVGSRSCTFLKSPEVSQEKTVQASPHEGLVGEGVGFA